MQRRGVDGRTWVFSTKLYYFNWFEPHLAKQCLTESPTVPDLEIDPVFLI